VNNYTIVESYIYEVHANTEEEARELFQTFMEDTDEDTKQETGVEFIDNQLEIEEKN